MHCCCMAAKHMECICNSITLCLGCMFSSHAAAVILLCGVIVGDCTYAITKPKGLVYDISVILSLPQFVVVVVVGKHNEHLTVFYLISLYFQQLYTPCA